MPHVDAVPLGVSFSPQDGFLRHEDPRFSFILAADQPLVTVGRPFEVGFDTRQTEPGFQSSQSILRLIIFQMVLAFCLLHD